MASVMAYQLIDRDYERDSITRSMEGRPWRVTNNFPFPIQVYIKSPNRDGPDSLGRIQPTKSISVTKTQNGFPLINGDEIHVTFPSVDGKVQVQQEVVRPFYLFDDSREINIGAIVYETLRTTQHIPLNKDISGIRIHNHIGFPLDVYMMDYRGAPFNGEPRFERQDPNLPKGQSRQPIRLARIGADDGSSFMAGSKNSIFTTNDYYGFAVGDKFTFVLPDFPIGGGKTRSLVYGTATIPDNYLSDIKVGVIQQHRGLVPNDIFSYRVNELNLSGLRYFEPDTAYQPRVGTQDRFSGYQRGW